MSLSRFCLSIGIPYELKILPKLKALAKKHGVKTVATNDVHYIRRGDSFYNISTVLLSALLSKFRENTYLQF